MFRYSEQHLSFIKANVKGRPYVELLEMFNAEFGADLSLCALMGTCKRYKLPNGNDGRFPKGHEPFNKGMKGSFFGGVSTQFKKGLIPANRRPIGSERINAEGYIEIKVEPKKWRLKHVVLWEQANKRPVPRNHAVIYADGDRQNLDIDNLVLVTRAQLLYMNQNNLIFKDAELTKAGANIARLNSAIKSSAIRSKVIPCRAAEIRAFMQEHAVPFVIHNNENPRASYLYFMKDYVVRISDSPGKAWSKKTTFNLGNYVGADGGVEQCKKWILGIMERAHVHN